ncbi:MAG: hypothetical protein QG657_600 [Acidobacteriota bacterium]|nr:hypothetical protein [Acidobacteriota bacterium]
MNDQTTQVNHVSLGEWMITMLIAAIPLVNIIMLFVWGFGSNTNPSKANWAKATLIWCVIAIVLYFLVFATMLSTLGERFRY